MAPTFLVPNTSLRYAGMVAKPPYMEMITQVQRMKRYRLPLAPADGIVAYSTGPSRKKTA